LDVQHYSIGDNGKENAAFISIGSNIGNSIENCRKGISALKNAHSIHLKKSSEFYKTEPVDYTDQAWFINIVVEIITSLDPIQLFSTLKRIEKEAGRIENNIRFGPRILDLDILFFDDLVLETSQLVIPHPRMHKRRFVLRPICDINPDFVHPLLHKTMRDLLENLTDKGQGIIEYK